MPPTPIALFVQQVSHGHCPCSEVRHLPGGARPFTPAAYGQARARLPLAVYQALLPRVVDAAALPATRVSSAWWVPLLAVPGACLVFALGAALTFNAVG